MNLSSIWRHNRLAIVVVLFGLFWVTVASVMIMLYTRIIYQGMGNVSIAQGLPFTMKPPVQSPCVTHFCTFYGKCFVNATTSKPVCKCLDNCEETITSHVCGTDGRTYRNECEMKLSSCLHQRSIRVHTDEPCKDPCDGRQCDGGRVCKLDDNRKAVCMCETDCAQIVAPVCGNDGQTYSNECLLRQAACQSGREISILYNAKCREDNPCGELKCGPHKQCFIDNRGEPQCACPAPCQQVSKPVCGSNRVTFENICELERHSCLQETLLTLYHNGPCEESEEDQTQCRSVRCQFDADCKVIDGRPQCVCPTCRVYYDPVCGNNGMPYENECDLRRENCEKRTNVVVEHRGLCDATDCSKNNSVCQYYSYCHTDPQDNISRCVCPSHCEPTTMKVCGTDGVTYNNQCELRLASCKNRALYLIASFGECVDCNGVKCKYGSTCRNGKCECPEACPDVYRPVCASDGRTYSSNCEMQKQACRNSIELTQSYSGECRDPDYVYSGEGSGGILDCDDSACQFGGTCHLLDDGRYQCVCSFSCDAIRSPVCGSDGIVYGNHCEMQAASCDKQYSIIVQSMDNCDEIDISGEACDGMRPVINPSTGLEYRCNTLHDCPGGTICHLPFGKCCNNVDSLDMSDAISIGSCRDSLYGCCPDGVTSASGPYRAGCPDQCECNMNGSLGPRCDNVTKQCDCKPNVTGLKCDGCFPGFWGIHLNNPQKAACIPCQCHHIGSIRLDCRQMTGRCECKAGYDGLKCDKCAVTRKPIDQYGCPEMGKTCKELNCRFGATCSNILHQCICDIRCPAREHRFMSWERVCGSNDVTYTNECQLRKDACRKQTNIILNYYGPCQVASSLTLGPTDSPFTTQPRKTPRHINPSKQHQTNMTPRKPKSTHKPPIHIDSSKYGRIGDLCLEGPDESYCLIPNSHCRLAICECNEGYIPTAENTECSKVMTDPAVTLIPDNFTTCTLNPCRNNGVCILDDELGYRCLCRLGKSGTICNKGMTFMTPSFSGTSFVALHPIGNISGDFYLSIEFHTMNRDGILLFSSQRNDGTGPFISLAISGGHVEFRFDQGSGPTQIRHPYVISQEQTHKVEARKQGNQAILVVDSAEPAATASIGRQSFLDLSGRLYLGYLPQNMSFVQEKIGVNMGFVGCIKALTAGTLGFARIYNLEFGSSSSNIVDGLDVVACALNPCQSIPCQNGGTCAMLNTNIYQCICPKGYTGLDCEEPLDLCTHSPCHRSATCSLNDQGEIICHCPSNREGQYCEFEKLADLILPEFTGNSYLILPIQDNIGRQMSIEVWFISMTPNGVLLYTSQSILGDGDFMSLNLVNLVPEFRFDLGDGPVILRSSSLVTLNKWHKLTIKRSNREAELRLDTEQPVRGSSQGQLMELQFSGTLYVGGYKQRDNLPPDSKITQNFTGTIQRIYINGRLIEDPYNIAVETHNVEKYSGPPCNMNLCLNGGVCVPNLDSVECKCPKRYIGKWCEKIAENLETSLPVRFDGEMALQYYNAIDIGRHAQKGNKFQLRFKSHQSAGLLLFQNQGPSVLGDYLALAITDGRVEFSYNLGKQAPNSLMRLRSSVYVSDGQWHTIYAERDRQDGRLQVDKEPIRSGSSAPGASQLDTDGNLWIGGSSDVPMELPSDYRRKFKGCIGDVFVDDKELHLSDNLIGVSHIKEFCH